MTETVFALAIGALFLFRLFWTKTVGGTTRLPNNAPGREHLASKAVHIGLYVSVFGIVLSELGIALAYATPWLGRFVMSAMIGLTSSCLRQCLFYSLRMAQGHSGTKSPAKTAYWRA